MHMECVELPKDFKGNVVRPQMDVFNMLNGKRVHIDGFTFGEDGKIDRAIQYDEQGKGHHRIPVVMLEVDEPDEERKELTYTEAILALTLSEL